MANHEQTIQEHVESNLAVAIDQRHEYEDAFVSFLCNVGDSVQEDGYSDDDIDDSRIWFVTLWNEATGENR